MRRTPAAPRLEAPTAPAHELRLASACMSVLLGAAAAMVTSALMPRLGALRATASLSDGAVLGAALVALALGVRVPHHLAAWACAIAWRPWTSASGGAGSSTPPLVMRGQPLDRPLHWLTLSIITFATGVAIALLPLEIRMFDRAFDGLLNRFVWSDAPLLFLRGLTAFLVILVPLGLLGLAASCMHHLACRAGQWDTRATGWLWVGAAGGAWVTERVHALTARIDIAPIAAALPVMTVALLSAGAWSARATRGQPGDGNARDALPTSADRWPTLLRASIVALAIAGAGTASVWTHSLSGTAVARPYAAVLMLLAIGLGILFGSRGKRSGFRSIGGFGVACASAGAALATGPIALLRMPSAKHGPLILLAFISLTLVAFAAAYGHQVLLSRVGSRSSVGAITLARMLLASALTVWLVTPAAVRAWGAPTTVAAAAFGLLALGGTLVIHEPTYSRRTRRLRLCAIFGVIGLIVGLALYAS